MPILSKPSSAAPTSLFYITLGAILTVWSGIWYMYMQQNPPNSQALNYICMGLLLTGIVFLVIGLLIGPLSRMARHAELPPTEDSNPPAATNVASTDPAFARKI